MFLLKSHLLLISFHVKLALFPGFKATFDQVSSEFTTLFVVRVLQLFIYLFDLLFGVLIFLDEEENWGFLVEIIWYSFRFVGLLATCPDHSQKQRQDKSETKVETNWDEVDWEEDDLVGLADHGFPAVASPLDYVTEDGGVLDL